MYKKYRWMVGCIKNIDGWLDVQKNIDEWVRTCDTCGSSAASNWKLGPHAVSTIVKCLQSPGCCGNQTCQRDR